MSTTYTDYSAYGNATVFVSNSSELNAAIKSLAASGGGTVKVDPNGGPYDLSVSGVGSAGSPVLVQSSGSAAPLFESMTFTNSSYIAVDGVNLDTSYMTSRSQYEDDLRIDNSSHIEIVNSTFTGSAKGYLSEATSSDVQGTVGANVFDSDNITLSGNTFSNYYFVVKMVDTTEIDFTGNEITQWQGDAFHGGGIQDVLIADNYMHDPLGSTQTMTHSDFIQIRMVATDLENRNIEIANNLLDTEGGPAAQGIHMGTGGSDGTNYNISIHDNVIITGLPRGISVGGADGLDVYDNTLLWDKESWVEASAGADKNSWDPRILVSGRDVDVSGNIATWIRVNGTQTDEGGYQIQYKNAGADNYADKHFNADGTIKTASFLYGEFGAAMSSGETLSYAGSSGDGGSGSEETPTEETTAEETTTEETTEEKTTEETTEEETAEETTEEETAEETTEEETTAETEEETAPEEESEEDTIPPPGASRNEDDGNFFSKILDMILGLFGGGKDKGGDVASEPAAASITLTERVLSTGESSLDDMLPDTGTDEGDDHHGDDDEDDLDIAA